MTAVWVGYPDKLVPMTTEFHGKPVAGGTFPALIWKAFMQKALDRRSRRRRSRRPTTATRRRSRSSTAAATSSATTASASNTAQLEFFGGEGDEQRHRVATCKANEVEIPDTRRHVARRRAGAARGPAADAAGRLQAGAAPGSALGVVVGQLPRRGTASAGDKITIVLRKSLHDVVPNVVGLSLEARAGEARAAASSTSRPTAPTAARSSSSRCARTRRRQPGERIVLTVRGTGG